jgi:putative acetyltransferase
VTTLVLRPYVPADEETAIELWRRTWQIAYPRLDFTARLDWWRQRWRNQLLPKAHVIVAERDDAMIGFVTIEPDTGYLDQIVVAPEAWGTDAARALLDEAKRIAPSRVTLHVNCDNPRAIRFYEKNGFVVAGNDVNPRSGAPVYVMEWRGDGSPSS